MIEFEKFKKIEQFRPWMSVTQKIHGTNAQIFIYEEDGEKKLACGSRSRWLSPGDDNHGFAQFVYSNKDEFIEKLGIGRHFGEWAGPGINNGEGLKEKTIFLFNWRRFKHIEKELPNRVSTVPLLYNGIFIYEEIEKIMDELKNHGSYICEYHKPEGIVIEFYEKFYKKPLITKK